MSSPRAELPADVPLRTHMPILAWEGSAAAWLRYVGRPTVRLTRAVPACTAGDEELLLLLLFAMIVNPSDDVSGEGELLLLSVALIRSDSILRRTLRSCVTFRYT